MSNRPVSSHTSSIYDISQQIKRWLTITLVTTVAGFLLLAFYSLLNPKSFTTPVAAQTQTITTIHFEDFTDVSSLTLNEDADTVPDYSKMVLRLVPSAQVKRGSAFASSPIPLAIEGRPTSFSTHFQFRISEPGGLGSADGLTFALAPSPTSIGELGLAMGYGGDTNPIIPSLAVEFDDYDNEHIDPNGNHVGIDLNGNMTSVATAIPGGDIDNGFPWYVWIDFDGETNQLDVYLSATSSRPATPLLSHILSTSLVDLMGSDEAYVGFTSATAAGHANHDIRFWHFVAGEKLLDSMIWNAQPECPFCSSTSAVGWAGGPINTRNGNLSYQETDLSIPVLGGNLQFQRSYASEAVDTYTTTLGHGWTHNYEMRLHFDDVAISDTVELQAPGGSRLPFFIGGGGVYTPYPGVTAQLEQQGNEYVVTGFNQMTYVFDSLGQLSQQVDPSGNEITFFHHDGLLVWAAQGERQLSYSYDGNGRLTTVSDNIGRHVEFGYENSDLVAVTNTLELVSTYEYSGSTHLLSKVIDPSGVIVEQTVYDGQGRAYRQWDGAGNLLVDIDYNLDNSRLLTENGVLITHTYDVRGTLIDVRYDCAADSANCQVGTAVSYDGNFKHNGIEDANGNQIVVAWNAGGSNLEKVSNALEQETQLTYDQFNNLTRMMDARSNPTHYNYDEEEHPTFLSSITDTLGNVTTYIPDANGLLSQEIDAEGNIISYTYNDFGEVTQSVAAANSADAITMTYGYDGVGRLLTTTQTSAAESHTTRNFYDAGDRLLATIANWDGSLDWTDCLFNNGPRDENICTSYLYDAGGRPISVTNALGQTNLTFYDSAGRVVTNVTNYDGLTAFGALCTDFSNPDPEYNICSLAGYDEYGRVVTSTNSLGHQTVTEYDSLGRVSRTIVNWEDGIFEEIDLDRDIITAYEYDAVGNVLVVSDPLGRQSRTFYDALNRVKGTMDNWDGEAELEDCASLPRQRDSNICSQYQYDEVGNTIFVTNSLTQTTRTFYDELNRVSASVQNWQPGFDDPGQCVLSPGNNSSENICTLYGYDAAGRQVTTTNALNQTTLTVYDAAARPFLTVANWDGVTPIEAVTDCQFPPAYPDINVCTFTTYDALGRQASTTNPLGNVTEFAYDGLGRLVTTTQYLDSTPVITVISYDALGNRLSSSDAEGRTTSYTYDSLNRLTQTSTAEGVTSSQVYNAAGWVLASSDGLGHNTLMTYDLMGRLIQVTDAENNLTFYEYDVLGNQTAMQDAKGVRTAYIYDGLNRLVEVIENHVLDLPSTDPPYQLITQYAYDALGNRVVITNARGFTSSYTLYDDLNRPVIVEDALGNQTSTAYNALGLRTVMTDGNTAVTEYSYDDLNRLLTASYLADEETVTYSYDAVGNRLAMQDGVGTTSYTYDDLYRLITVTNPFDAEVGYRYDLVGNRTHLVYPDGKVVSYTYDLDNRLIQVEDWDEGLTSYSYDAAGRLTTSELPNGVTTFYTYDDANRLTLLQHVDTSSSVIARYEYSLDAVGNRTAVSETLRLPTTSGGQASLPAGLVSGNAAPLTAAAAAAAIQPEPLTLDKERLSRPPVQGPPPPPEPTLPPAWTTQPPTALGLDAAPPPFDPAEIAERARNQVHSAPNGRAHIQRPGHSAHFAAGGSLAFAPELSESDALSVTLDPATALTVTLELAAASKGAANLPISLIPGQREIQENVLSQPRGPWLVEQFIARDGGIEQRWLLENAPPHSGDLALVVAATTALSLTVDGEGFVFHAPTLDEQTLPVARYGRALAIDAGGQEQWAELSFSELSPAPDGQRRYRLHMAIPAAWLATAQYPLLVDPLLSSLVRLEQSATPNDQSNVEIAYNPDQDEFLLVWQDFRQGNWDVYGQRVNGDGALLDENFIVTNADYRQSGPQVAYGSGVYLVAWRHHSDSSTTAYDVYGALISGTGQIITNSLVIANDSNDREEPTAVVYNSGSGQFLVLWQAMPDAHWHVWGRHVGVTGTMGSAFPISSQSNHNRAAAAGSYSSHDDQYLITWEAWSWTVGIRQIQGQRLDGSGSLVGSVFNIGAGSGDERNSDVLYLDSLERYVVVWQDDRDAGSNGTDIYRQLVAADGALDGSNTAVAATSVAESLPRLAADNQTGGALIVWQQDNGGGTGQDVLGHFLASNGALAGSSFAIQSESGNQQAPVLAQNSQGDYLFAWQDNRHGGWDIFSRLKQASGGWGGAGMAHPAPGDQEKPQIAYNPDDDEYLIVWQDYRSSTDWDIYGQRVAADGSLLGTNLTINTNATTHQLNPHVAYGANEYLVVWQHYTDSSNTTYDVRGRVISRTGSFVTSHFVIANATSGGSPLKETPRDVVYNSSSDQFLVLWQVEVGTGNWDIWARHVSPTGSTGSYIEVATDSVLREEDAAAAYNPEDDQYLVVWDEMPVSGIFTHQVYGRRLTGSGTVTTTDSILISTGVIASSAAPDVVYRADSGEYVVVWQQVGDIYSRGVLPDGSLAGSATAVATTTPYETRPRLASDTQGLLAIWQRDNSGSGYDLYARPLDSSGVPNGETFTVQETAGNQQNPAIAYGANQRTQLAWQDDREGGWDLYTAVLDRSYQVTHIQYEYDPLHRLTGALYSGDLSADYQYEYDVVGNMTAYTETIGAATTNVNRTFNAANQLVTASDTEQGTTSFTYDGNGNLITLIQPDGLQRRHYGYSQGNRLVSNSQQADLTSPVVLMAWFVYDGNANRLQQIDFTSSQPVTTTYTNDILGLSQVLVSDDGISSTHNLFGLDLIHVDDGSQTRILLSDGLGSVRTELVGASIETTTTYEPYGKLLAQIGATGTVYGFTGEAHDGATGLVYLRARYYNPSLKIFLSRDPFPGYATLPISQNGYAYVHANPVNRIDPSGLCIPTDDGRCYRAITRISRDLIDFQGASDQHWLASEKWQVNRAAWHIASRLAQTYNTYMHSFKISPYLVDNEIFRFICGENGRPLTSREAFLYFYGGRVLFYKTGTANGTAYGKYEYISAVNRSGIKVYTAANITSPNTGYRWATHEMGHYFEARVNDIRGWGHVRNTLRDTANIPRRGTDNDVNTYGFAGIRYGWQQSPEATAAEEFADMFLGWNYKKWETDEYGLTVLGRARSDFMDNHMASWIALVINRERQKTR